MKTQVFKSFEKSATSDVVDVLLDVTNDGDHYQKRVELSDAALTTHAVANGRNTWDEEHDICALAACTMPEGT